MTATCLMCVKVRCIKQLAAEARVLCSAYPHLSLSVTGRSVQDHWTIHCHRRKTHSTRAAEYCDVSVCLSVCLSRVLHAACPHLSLSVTRESLAYDVHT